jgi:16S rRNA (cytidine1402-2'-O)-methyltransferase
VEEAELMAKLREMEKDSRRLMQTQIFIETPYRNDRMLGMLLRALKDNTRVCVAANLSLATEHIVSRTVRDWRRAAATPLKDQPAVFLLAA